MAEPTTCMCGISLDGFRFPDGYNGPILSTTFESKFEYTAS